MFVEENDDLLLLLEVGRDEDWQVGLDFFGAKWKADIDESKTFEAFVDNTANSICDNVSCPFLRGNNVEVVPQTYHSCPPAEPDCIAHFS